MIRVAIDGPAGVGKSSSSKALADYFGFAYLDTGAMYRAVTFAALDRGIDLDDEAAIDALAEQIEIRFTNGTGEDTRLTIDGADASAAIRTPQVDANVSKVSAYPGVRAAMLIHQRRAAEDRDIVAEGRDIGTVVFPNAQVKVFLTAEGGGDPVEVYPNRVLTELMYPLFLAPQGADEIYIGEQESGDLLSLGLRDGGTTLLKSGTEPFSGVSGYTPGSLRAVSMTDPQNFSALAPNADGFALITSQDGEVTAAESLRPSLGRLALKVLWTFLRYLALLLAAMLLVYGFIHLLGRGRTILAKLILSSIPLLAVALVVFGVFSYRAYSAAITQSFQKQVEDEGNLLTALFGTESFDEIEYPYDYTGEAYGYLRQQMSTRPVHPATAYYEHQQLYIGVDFENPCFYPFDVRLDAGARELYLQAAYTGRAQSGVLDDENGRRLVSVTPVGGTSGTAVYLLEAGILTSNLDAYTASYLRTYVVVSLLFLAAIGALLTFLFRRVLTPIRQIRAGLEAFAQGDRTVRLETAVNNTLFAHAKRTGASA